LYYHKLVVHHTKSSMYFFNSAYKPHVISPETQPKAINIEKKVVTQLTTAVYNPQIPFHNRLWDLHSIQASLVHQLLGPTLVFTFGIYLTHAVLLEGPACSAHSESLTTGNIQWNNGIAE